MDAIIRVTGQRPAARKPVTVVVDDDFATRRGFVAVAVTVGRLLRANRHPVAIALIPTRYASAATESHSLRLRTITPSRSSTKPVAFHGQANASLPHCHTVFALYTRPLATSAAEGFHNAASLWATAYVARLLSAVSLMRRSADCQPNKSSSILPATRCGGGALCCGDTRAPRACRPRSAQGSHELQRAR
jgi:hypothetical protein